VTSIEVSTFSGCSSLTSVNIPSSVTSIGRNAFSGCSSLVTVILESNEIVSKKRRLRTIFGDQVQNYVIGETVETIGDEAFEGCSGITSITIPNSVTGIGAGAFSGCSGLTLITIPNSVTYIDNGAFEKCSNLTSATIGNGLTDGFDFSVFNYCSNLQTITLNCPEIYFYAAEGLTSLSEIILGKDVASIYGSFSCFESLASVKVEEGNTVYDSRDNCNAIIETATNTLIAGCKNTVIPQSITSIGGYAFSGCTGLASITIPDNVTSIGDYAFQGCSGLTSVTIGSGVTSIGMYAFQNCTSLNSISIPESMPEIGLGAFDGTAWMNDQPDGVLYMGTIAYGYKGVMPEGTAIDIKDGTTSIVSGAFSGCSNLSSVTIPESVTEIGWGAFQLCSGLTSIVIESGNPIYDSRDNCNAIIETSTNTLIIGCKNTIIPNSVTNIGSDAFFWCAGLTSVTIPNSVTSIGDCAFQECSGLTSVTIGNGVTSIGYSAFSRCTGLTSVTIPNSVTSIGDCAFQECRGLTSVTIGNGVTSIGDYAFSGCNNLKSIHITDLSAWCRVRLPQEGILAYHLYLNDEEITELVIPDDVQSIGDGAFYRCSSLTSVTFGSGVTSIGDWAFERCSNLTSVTLGSGVTSIGNGVFSGCTGMASIYIEEGNTCYDSRDNCNAIIETASNTLILGCKNTVIPESVTSIGDYAFSGCSGLTSITILSSITSIGNNAFYGCNNLKTVTLESNEVASENRSLSTIFGSQVQKYVIGDSVSSIGDYAFSGCSSLKNLIIPDGITSIGDGAFQGCSSLQYNSLSNTSYLGNTKNRYVVLVKANSSLTRCNVNAKCRIIYSGAFSGCNAMKSITIPEGVVSIGSHAFYECSSLTSVEIPNSVISPIGNQTFEGCRALTSVTISENVTSIDSRAFYNCSSLLSVTIPNSVTSIGEYAFGNCQELKNIYCFAEETPEVFDNTFQALDVSNILLIVPDGTDAQYKAHPIWGQFWVETPTCISEMEGGRSKMEDDTPVYNLAGQNLSKPQKGINIIRMSDGTTRKVLIK
jgi:hypothetical protein